MSKPDSFILLLDDEQRIVEKTRNIREKMVDALIDEKGIPTKTGEMRVVNEILNSLDNQVLGLVDRRLKHDENTNNGELLETIKTVFTELDNRKLNKPSIINTGTIDDKFIPDNIVPGEDKIEYEEIEYEDIIKG